MSIVPEQKTKYKNIRITNTPIEIIKPTYLDKFHTEKDLEEIPIHTPLLICMKDIHQLDDAGLAKLIRLSLRLGIDKSNGQRKSKLILCSVSEKVKNHLEIKGYQNFFHYSNCSEACPFYHPEQNYQEN